MCALAKQTHFSLKGTNKQIRNSYDLKSKTSNNKSI